MPLYIKNTETDRLARELARRTGETVTEAVTQALRERLAKADDYVPRDLSPEERMEVLREIQERISKLPVLDDRDPDDILYDEGGAPK